MKRFVIVLVSGFLSLLIAVFSCTKENAGTKEQPPVYKETAEEKTSAPASEALQTGSDLFQKHCTVCHGTGGKGDIGPSLIDNEWKYGGDDDDLYFSIAKGRPGGMPSWDHTLNEENIRAIMVYIRSIGEE